MALSPRLDLRQTQSLVMTPQLQQAIKLLQLSNMELTAFVEEELERNPLLETDDRERTPDEPAVEADTRTSADEPLVDSLPGQQEEAPLDLDYDNTWNNDSQADGGGGLTDWGGRGGRLDFEDGDSGYEQTVAREIGLRDHLVSQINVDLTDPADRLIAVYLVEMVDEAGYLIGSIEDAAVTLGCPLERVEAILERLQRFDPPGIFARNLAECLTLQLKDKNRFDPAMQSLIEHLDMLARREITALMRVCGVDAEDLSEMIAEIRALDPKPALIFDHVVAQPVTPDVLMRPAPGGGWIVELNSDTLPRVLVNTRYYTKVVTSARNKEEKSYLSERFQSANWLVKSLHQRANTILKVASELVRQQEAFFQKGIQHLRPLVLRDIASAISMHESTVSRVTANKYMATPRGIYELKYFFTQAIAGSDGGEAHSAESVRHRIKSLIDAEVPNDILSDDRIVDILKADGVDIARRTVAKYREAMHIASSVQRRREKTMGS
ncbi:RNA polymerase factor sigma-54 [Telmatospirillum siberiense]|uniref:RNA polymerase sigma-54 factor n=1 Tax=Telmatospirillum siberiense TaxID=382514 RepID=A0A2N3PSP1_9PROT|nr:RNA polymerase factor sigma-54 [Telmatospirillum siberiense]PKU23423.1 RNA polymerase sigma-54 factor [Telmatospirillum siberiense]